ncbi:MAG: radical SAM protein [Acutalibacteraceae bacterium]|nr:radical SAM protein [Acutalibacteraceae bacterium]
MIPEVLDFRITSRCNMRCPFCFGPHSGEDWDIQSLRQFISFLQINGLKFVVLTGGEPTSSPAFIPVVKMLRSLGIHIALSTNGTFWLNENLRSFILSSCNCIALPIESPSAVEHNYLRKSSYDHHKLIYSILPQIKELAPNIKIKIGTVATKYNYISIPKILGNLPIQPNVWKIFQLSLSDVNLEFYKKQKISNTEFEELLKSVHCLHKHSSVKICASYEEDRNGQYLFLEPNGNLMTIKDGVYHVIGNYKSFGEPLIRKIQGGVDINKVNSNFFQSFGF